MLTKIPGLVVRETPVNDKGRYIEVLTEDFGVFEIFVHGSLKSNSTNLSATQLFSYADFWVEKNRLGKYYFKHARPIWIFYRVRENLEAFSLANYFAELMRKNVPEEYEGSEFLRLILNCLYYLTDDTKDKRCIKAIFELRLATELGYTPDLLVCDHCYKFLPEKLVFNAFKGRFWCEECFDPEEHPHESCYHMPESALNMIRHLCLADQERLYDFKAGDDIIELVGEFSEEYVRMHVQSRSDALNYYYKLKREGII